MRPLLSVTKNKLDSVTGGRVGIGWFFFALLVPGLLAGSILFHEIYLAERAQLEQGALQTARALSHAMDRELASIRGKLQILSTSPSLQAGDLQAFYRQSKDALATENVAVAIVLIDETGQQVINTLRPRDSILPKTGHLEMVRQTFERGEPRVSDLYIGGVARRPFVALEVPVWRDGKVAYALDMGIPVERLNQLLIEQGLPLGWVATLLDTQGTVVARSQNADRYTSRKATPDLLAAFEKAKEGVIESHTLEGEASFVAFSRSNVSGWTLAVAMRRGVLQASLYRPLAAAGMAIVAFLLAGAALAWFFTHHLRAALSSLQGATAAGTAGNLEARAPIVGPREIVLLAKQFNELQQARQRADEKLQRSQMLLMQGARIARLGTWAMELRDLVEFRRNPVTWSAELYRLLDYTPATVPVPCAELFFERVHPEDRALFLDHIEQAFTAKSSWQFEYRLVLPDGRERVIQDAGEFVSDSQGNPSSVVGVLQDVTARNEAESALYDSNARFQAIFDQAAVGIARVALDGRWLQVNEGLCSILGYSRQELLELTFQDITYPPDLEADLAQVEKVLTGQAAKYSMEKRYIRKDGDIVWVNVLGSLVYKPNGEADYAIAVVDDIQARKEVQRALETARQLYLQRLELEVAERTAALQEAHDYLEERVAERTEQLRNLAVDMTFAEERERQAIARDLHDDLGQQLHVVKLRLDMLAKERLSARGAIMVGETSSLISDASRLVRSLISQLSPPVLTTMGLPSALQWLCGEIQETYGLEVSCRIEAPTGSISPTQTIILFRAARELLINAVKHSGSRNASLDFVCSESALSLTVADPGNGRRVAEESLAGIHGFGLASIRERISFLGGMTKIHIPPNGGVRVTLELPLEVNVGAEQAHP